MTDLVDRLRRLYVEQGTNYVQEAADEIERLRALLRRVDVATHADGAKDRTESLWLSSRCPQAGLFDTHNVGGEA